MCIVCDCGYICYVEFLWCFFFKQKTAYEMRISDWSSDVCSSDLPFSRLLGRRMAYRYRFDLHTDGLQCVLLWPDLRVRAWSGAARGARDGERDTAVRAEPGRAGPRPAAVRQDRKSTRLNSSH